MGADKYPARAAWTFFGDGGSRVTVAVYDATWFDARAYAQSVLPGDLHFVPATWDKATVLLRYQGSDYNGCRVLVVEPC